jgi:hypothetical protein
VVEHFGLNPHFTGLFRDLNMTPRVSRKTYLDWAIHRPKVLGACIPCLGVGKLLKRVKMAPENWTKILKIPPSQISRIAPLPRL